MKITEIIDRVQNEKQIPGRFPARIIFVQSWKDYVTLAEELQRVCDVTLNLAKFAKGDTIPRFKELRIALETNSQKTTLLLSFGEYLRLCTKWEKDKTHDGFKDFWELIQPESATTKHIFLIFGGRELFDDVISYVDVRQSNFIWEATESQQVSEFNITVYSPDFADAVSVDIVDFSEWLEKWDELFSETRNSFALKTKLYKYVGESFGDVKIKVINEPFSYITSLITDGDALRKEYGDDSFWNEMLKNAQVNKPFSATVDFALNVGKHFDSVAILARLMHLNNTERRLFWLRHKIYAETDYVSFAISKTSNPEEIPIAIRDAVFGLENPTDTQLAERIKAISVLELRYDDSYFAKVDKILPTESRLMYLSYKTHTERVYVIKIVSELLRKGVGPQAIVGLLQSNFPELSEYLSPTKFSDRNTDSYFNWYRKSKLINRPPEDVPISVINFEAISYRDKVIQGIKNHYPLWIDGLGAEWIPLLVSELHKITISVQIDCNVARSRLPSETTYNRQRGTNTEKWDRFDKLSHSGMPDDKDYFSCFAHQIKCIQDVAKRVEELLIANNCIVITGDHGSSRLAALMFHYSENYAIVPPKGSKVCSFGRFCELSSDDVQILPSMELIVSNSDGKDIKCIVMKTYEHFIQCGNAAGGNTDDKAVAGEVHGGMTPEEHLVPVVIVKRKEPLIVTEPPKRMGYIQNDLGMP